ncbi:hypothetical protein AACH06_20490 [Ideonella sp. DXS29W]|uniref:Uncharacterized protein n=1 Tax=Ideonella lacteola TaxID=2984193 RepID=A0ABU9BT99_9BURK
MSKAAQPSLLRRLIGRRTASVPDVDPADMGTAMGLDFCLDEPPADVVAATTLAQSGRASLAQVGWLRRLGAS